MDNKPVPTEADMPHNCPHCGVSLLGGPIPEDIKENYSGNYWKREIGIELQGEYDGVAYYRCPDCDAKFDGLTHLRMRD